MSSIDLPGTWALVPIEDVLAKQSDGKAIHQGWSPQCLKEPRHGNEWGVLKTTAIQAGKFEPEHNKKLPTDLQPRPLIEVADGDLLVTCAGPRVRCGVSCLVRSSVPRLMLSGKMYRFRPDLRAMDARYLEAFLQSDEAQFAIDRMKTGGSESGLNLTHDRFKQLEVRVAPLAEQVRIADKVEELLSDLDAGVAELKAAQRKLAQYRQSLLKAAVEGALTADWRAAHGQPQETGAELLQRILSERRARWEQKQLAKFAELGKAPPKGWQAKYPEPVAPDLAELPLLPEGWTWASLDQLVAESSYGTSVKCGYESSGDPVLRIPNVSGGKLDFSDIKFSSESLNLGPEDHLAIGDVLVIRTNGSIGLVGRAAVVSGALPAPYYFASYLLRLRCVETSYTHRWISAALASHSGRRWIEARAASSAGQHNISLSTLLTMPLPLPPLAEQADALNAADVALESAEQHQRVLDKSLAQAAAQRKNILKAAFAGHLVSQNPNDEPASVLLARIRAERASNNGAASRRRRKTA